MRKAQKAQSVFEDRESSYILSSRLYMSLVQGPRGVDTLVVEVYGMRPQRGVHSQNHIGSRNQSHLRLKW